MKVLVSGKGGQLATELERTLPSGVELVSLSATELDITNRSAVLERIASESPDLIINAALSAAWGTLRAKPGPTTGSAAT